MKKFILSATLMLATLSLSVNAQTKAEQLQLSDCSFPSVTCTKVVLFGFAWAVCTDTCSGEFSYMEPW